MTTLLKMIISSTLISTPILAQTTMCFIKDVKDITTLEDIKLNGGECKSANSLNEMKKKGWDISDIKINNNDYIYILKKGSVLSWDGNNTNIEALEEKLLKKMEEKRKKQIAEKKLIAKQSLIASGKSFYTLKCKSCHGDKGELEPQNSRSIKNLNLKEFEYTMNGYRGNTYDRGSAASMRGYALTSSTEDVRRVFEYLKSINTK